MSYDEIIMYTGMYMYHNNLLLFTSKKLIEHHGRGVPEVVSVGQTMLKVWAFLREGIIILPDRPIHR